MLTLRGSHITIKKSAMKSDSNIVKVMEVKTACVNFQQGSQATSKCHEH